MQHKKKQKKGQHIMRHTRFTRTWFSRSSLSILSTELNLGSNRPGKMIFGRRTVLFSFESFTLDIGVVEQVMKSVMISNKDKVHAERPVTFSYICVWYISPIFKQQQGRTMTMTANRMTIKTTTTKQHGEVNENNNNATLVRHLPPHPKHPLFLVFLPHVPHRIHRVRLELFDS